MRRRDRGWRVFACLLPFLLLTLAGQGQEYTFEVFAGPDGGKDWFDGSGNTSRFNVPWGITADASSNLYVVDGGGCIRKVTSAGVVTTLAGDCGPNGGIGDGPGGQASFNNPRHVAIDASGNLYVADMLANLIRKVTPAGMVTTIAGTGAAGSADGPALSATFNRPSGIALDSAGNIYVSDRFTHVIRKISGGTVTTFAGAAGVPGTTNSPARFNGPAGLAVDSSNNVYVADSGNCAIRRITPGGVVSTFAGLAGTCGRIDGPAATARFFEVEGLAIDATDTVWVTNAPDHSIRRITSGGDVTTFAGGNRGDADGIGTAAAFLTPTGIVKAPNGNLYVTESLGKIVRRITPAAEVSKFVGRGFPDGHHDGVGTAARFRYPVGVETDAAGNLYVADRYTFTIRKITPAGSVTTFAGLPFDNGSDDGASGRFSNPYGIALDTAENVYVTELFANKVRKVTPAGTISTLAGSGVAGSANGTGTAAQFNGPTDAAVDSSNNVFVTDRDNHTIRKITSGGVVTTFAGAAGSPGWADGSGGVARFSSPTGIVRDSANNLFVTDTNNHVIRRITPAGSVTTFAGSAGAAGFDDGTGGAARFYNPAAIAIDALNNLFVYDAGSRRIRRVTPGGVVTTVAGSSSEIVTRAGTGLDARFLLVHGLAVSPSGLLYVSEYDNSAIIRGTVALAAKATIDQPTGEIHLPRQLGVVNPGSGSTFQWSMVRRPSGSSATLSSATAASPTFTPDKPDTWWFRLIATGSTGLRSITMVRLEADCGDNLTLGPASLPDGYAGQPYSQTLSAGGGTPPYSFVLAYGSPGLTLSPSGTLSGTPSAGYYSYSVRVVDSVGCSAERSYGFNIYPYPAPTGLVAHGGNATSVALTWNAVAGAHDYRIYRRSPGSWYDALAVSASNSYTDTMVSTNKAYAYFVTARDASGNETAQSNIDIATAMLMIDPSLAGVPVKDEHFMQLRQAVNALRDLAGYPSYAFSDGTLNGVPIKAIHLTQLREQLNFIRSSLGVSTLTFTDDPVGAARPIKAIHINQLRNGVK